MQVQKSLQKINCANPLRPERDEACQQVLEKLRDVWQVDIQPYQNTGHDGMPQVSILPQLGNTGNAYVSEDPQSVHAPFRSSLNIPMDPALTLPSADSFHVQARGTELPLNNELRNTEDAMDSINDFDAYLFEMSLVPSTRG